MRRLGLRWLGPLLLLLAAAPCFATATATPVISLASGTYTMPQTTTISDSTSGSAITYCYSTAVITSCTGTTYSYSTSIYVSPTTNETLCAYANASGYTQSTTTCNTWTNASSGGGGSGVAAAPTFSLAGGTYAMPTGTTLTDSTSGATISWCYAASAITSCSGVANTATYSAAIYINPSTQETICASATASGFTQSPYACNTYITATGALGDTRTVVQPVIPTGCTPIPATKFSVFTTTLNVDPFNPTASNPGVLGSTGGTSLEPSSCSGTYNPLTETCSSGFTNVETTDNTAVMNVLNGSPSNQCGELTIGPNGEDAFVFGPWSLVSNVTLVGDPGIAVYGSRNVSLYGSTSTCGVVPTGSSATSCGTRWLSGGADNAGLMGYFLMDARGWDKFLNNSGASGWNYSRVQSYCNDHKAVINGSPTCTPSSGATGISYGPDMMHFSGANNLTLYGFTMKDCGNFCLYWGDNADGLTAWDIKIMAPFEVSNTDGFDPSYAAKDWTIASSFISNGDNHIAVKSDCGSSCSGYTSGATTNGSILNLQTASGIGVEIGYNSSGGVSSILSNGLRQNGNHNNAGQQEGHGIKTPNSQGGAVSKVMFENSCLMNETKSLIYDAASGAMTGISDINDHILSGNVTGNSGSMLLVGTSSNPLGLTLGNVVADGSTPGSSYSNANISGQNVSFTPSGSGVTNSITNPGGNTPFPCTPTTWQPITGDLVMKTASLSNQLCPAGTPCTFSGSSSVPMTLQAIVRPTMDVSTKEASGLTNPITFYDSLNGGAATSLGTGAIGYNGMTAMLAISATPGTHVYTATYPADSNYSAYSFGSVNVTVGAPAPAIAPGPGGYTSPLTVTITDSGATAIWYTKDGSTPSAGGGTSISYSAPFSLTLPATVKAIAVFSGGTSAVSSSAYTSGAGTTVAPPAVGIFSPGP